MSPRAALGAGRADARISYGYNRRGLTTLVIEGDAEGLSGLPNAPNPAKFQTFYDPDGRPVLLIDPMKGEHLTTYDGYGRVKQEVQPDGTATSRFYEFGSNGKRPVLRSIWTYGPISELPRVLEGTTQDILAAGELIKTSQLLSAVYFLFDQNQRPIVQDQKLFSPRDPPSPSALSQPYEKTIANLPGAKSKTWHSAAGHLTQSTDGAGRSTHYKNDAKGRLELVTLPGGQTITYKYEGYSVETVTSVFKPDF